jgi:hypothetical protein
MERVEYGVDLAAGVTLQLCNEFGSRLGRKLHHLPELVAWSGGYAARICYDNRLVLDNHPCSWRKVIHCEALFSLGGEFGGGVSVAGVPHFNQHHLFMGILHSCGCRVKFGGNFVSGLLRNISFDPLGNHNGILLQ